ncbi:MAG TPA: fatty acid desaturase [Polyangiaceae bacterium]|nr:fatty acid desaturase [Polyangiaceae bacterium]
MRLRFVADRRTLLWAFLLFPLGPALALARPALLPFLAPLLLYCSYLSGVLTHNHNHVPVFHARGANLAYGAWLSFFYGFPIVSWLPTHNQNHHRYRNGEGDVTATARHASRDGLFAALSYPPSSSRNQLPALLDFTRQAFRRRSWQMARIVAESAAVVFGHAAALALFVALHGAKLGALGYFCALGLPALLGPYWMMLTNYLQHVGCEPTSEHDHSRNFVSPLFNWFVFDNGYHTVHHEQPTAHWSRYRELHLARAAQIDGELQLPGTLAGYFFRRYLGGGAAEAYANAEVATTNPLPKAFERPRP